MLDKVKRTAALLLAVLLLSGCVRKEPSPTTQGTQDTRPTETTGTEPTQTEPSETEPSETTEPTEPPPSLDPVTKLFCTRWRTFPQLLSLGGGIVLASRNFYSPDHGAIINSMELINVYEDTVVQTLMNDTTREPVEQRFADACFVTADPENGCFYVYDRQFQLLDSFSAPNVDGFFSYDRANYYYVENDVLCRMDVASGNRGRMALELDLRLESLLSIHPNEELLVVRFYLSPYTTDCGIAVIDTATGEVKLLTDDFIYIWLTGDTFYGMRIHDEIYGYDLYYGDLNGGQIQKLPTEQLSVDRMSYTMLPGSDLLMCKAALDDESGTAVRNIATGESCNLNVHDFTDSALGCIYLPDEQLIMGFYENGYDFDPIIIDPKVLAYEESLTPETADWQETVDVSLAQTEEPALPASLAEVRTLADDLEEKYGVTILLGEQVTETCDRSGCKAQTLENAATIQAALEKLDAALALYPGEFPEQFRNGANEGGLYFCLTGSIDGTLEPVGFAGKNRDRYNLALDITDSKLAQTIHHEIWHAIEMKLSTDTFDTAQWHGCNPSGFDYYGRYDGGYLNLTKWTYANGSGTESRFVDPYSRINGREDRARIWEYVMSTDATELLEAAAIRKKLEIMSDAIREGFDTDGWTDVFWERYL